MKGTYSFLGEKNALQQWALILRNSAAELIYPSNIYCICCENLIDDSRPYALCDHCLKNLRWAVGKTCASCGKLLQEGYGRDLCTDCTSHPHSFRRGYTCLAYGGNVKDMLLKFKHGQRAYYGKKLAQVMADRIEPEELDLDLILPVPMYRKKQQKRGYNQAEVMANQLGKLMEIPCEPRALIRLRDTPPMKGLGPEERRANMENAFTVPPKWGTMINGKRILLIDDIYTTGSTVDACSEILLAAGAVQVFVLTLAAGANRLRA